MPLDFPNSPTIGQQFSYGLQTWVWDGLSWNIAGTLATSLQPFRNLLDNGGVDVCQRATSIAGVGTTSGVRCADRWWVGVGGANVVRWTVNQATEAPAGFGLTRSAKYLCTTAAVPAAGDYVIHTQGIEGQFLQHLLWGTALAKPLTLSFWVRSNKTGLYIAEIYIVGPTYGITYTINDVDTWEYKTITFPGNTVSALTNDSSSRLTMQFWLQAGSTYSGGSSIPAAWTSVVNTRAVGQVNVGAAVNNYWQITGVQLEVGSVATAFEIRAYDREFERCQRYFQRWSNPALRGIVEATGQPGRMGMALPTLMRVGPTPTVVTGINVFDGSAVSTVTAISQNYSTPIVAEMNFTGATGLTLYRPCVTHQGAGTLDLSAEI